MANFVPRLDSSGMSGSKFYYSDNVFYPAYGLPNCTCYAWGRFYEISGVRPHLPTGDAGTWWNNVSGYEKGQDPKLGAVACMAGGPYSGCGHVAVVEELNSDGTVTCSNSAWGGTYFYLTHGNRSNKWGYAEYNFQGFIYNPNAPSGTLAGGGGGIQIDYKKLNPYVVTLNYATPTNLNYKAMKENGVIGGIVEGGNLFMNDHTRKDGNFRNPHAYEHVLKLNENDMHYGYWFFVVGQTESEIEEELYEMSFLIRKYPPTLGVWLQTNFMTSKTKAQNDALLNIYKKGLYRLGLKKKIGLYIGKSQLDRINWSKHKDEWYLWYKKSITKLDEIDKLLDPEFFDMEGQYT